jgi:GalNAc-alpha-(1->4)-GalNAc-alpha-(1->3)-diNAcBac-PP-undecaprenol alpha-1,4-N-acetyl-D-galactosaminyltransferase
MRITLVISKLITGGAERVMSVMANYWASHRRKVTLITIASQEMDCCVHPRVKLDSRVIHIGLGMDVDSNYLVQAARNNAERVKRLRQEIRASRPDVVISFLSRTNILTLLASIGLGTPVIVSERIDPRQRSLGLVWGALRYLMYRQADGLVVQSQEVCEWARKFVAPRAIHVIPNPVEAPLEPYDRIARSRESGRTVVAMGRLVRQKGIDLLLEAWSRCAKKHGGWSLLILGEGEERQSLEALVSELELKDRVSLPGTVPDPARVLQRADLFVMSSRYEGFPNALLEAMACGLAVISTDCPSGPGEIVRDGVDGILVHPNNVDALASAMDRLMSDGSERERLALRAVEVTERFGLEKVMGMWETVVQHTLRGETL